LKSSVKLAIPTSGGDVADRRTIEMPPKSGSESSVIG